jgi:uncharacterized membrane protein
MAIDHVRVTPEFRRAARAFRLLHALDHQLRRAGVRFPLRHFRLPARPRLGSKRAPRSTSSRVGSCWWRSSLRDSCLLTFNFHFNEYLLAGVIWMLGWCMVIMAAVIWLPTVAIGALGVGMIFLHNLMDFLPATTNQALSDSGLAPLWQILYFGGPIQLGDQGPTLAVLYSLIPWVGVMAAGYAFGAVMTLEQKRRDNICVGIGVGAIILFFALRTLDVYGDPRHWHNAVNAQLPTFFRYINTTKYPASLQFLLMTLGPTILLMPVLDRARGKIGEWIATFGRVPMFYYLMHIPAIHLAAVIVSLIREGGVDPWLFANHPMMNPPPPDDYTWPLWLLYLVFAIVVGVLYFPSRWYWRRKSTNPAPWMRCV